MKLWKYILPLIAAVIFASCSSKDEAEVIPRAKLADIYVDMFIIDQWISDTPGMRLIADTSLVYEPILEKYGYDKLDYVHSVDFYMNDPERFARILRSSMDKLDKRIVHLQKIKKQQERADEVAKTLERFKMDHTFEEYFPYMADEPYVHYYDSLTFEADSLMVYRLVAIETADTLYDRLQMIVHSDTLSVCDTVAPVDTVLTVEPIELEKPIEPVKPGQSVKSVKSVKPAEGKNAFPAKKISRPEIHKDSTGRSMNLNNTDKLWQLNR